VGLPANVAKAIEEYFGTGATPERGQFIGDESCAGARFHSPSPLTVEEVPLSPDEDSNGPAVLLCPTCAANLAVLKALLWETNGILPWPVRRDFGNQLRALAFRGWAWYSSQENSHAG
jgi:hypothetical protein